MPIGEEVLHIGSLFDIHILFSPYSRFWNIAPGPLMHYLQDDMSYLEYRAFILIWNFPSVPYIVHYLYNLDIFETHPLPGDFIRESRWVDSSSLLVS